MPKSKLALFFLFFFLFISQTSAQSGRIREGTTATGKADDQSVIKLRVEEVLLPISIRTRIGQLPSRLDQHDFIVSEDGKRQALTAVMRTRANIVLLLDGSGTATNLKNIGIHRELAHQMIEALGEEDRAAIVSYGDTLTLISDWTSDKAALKEALARKFRPGLKSNFYESLLYVAGELLPKAEGRRSIIAFTDGVDSFNPAGLNKAIAALHHARATVYALTESNMIQALLRPKIYNKLAWYEMLDPKVQKRYTELRRYYQELENAEAVLARLAEETGGTLWNPEGWIECSDRQPKEWEVKEFDQKTVSCATLRSQIVEEIGTEYVLAYSSERKPDDKEFHLIKVYTDKPDWQVRVRRGVYSGLPEPPKDALK